MKKLIYLISFFSAFCISIILVSQLITTNTFSSNTKVQQCNVDEVIEEFWQNSLQGNTEIIKALTTKIPDNYYEMENKCAEQKGEIIEKLNSGQTLIQLRKDFTESDRNYALNYILFASSNIKQENYVYHKIINKRKSDNHALARVEYGKDQSYLKDTWIYLNKVADKWKIFKISNSGLEIDNNKFFAKADCSETIP